MRPNEYAVSFGRRCPAYGGRGNIEGEIQPVDKNSRSSEEIRPPQRNRAVEGSVRITDLTEEARGSPAFDKHEQVVLVTHQGSGLRALIAIHDRTLGPALGGCRMWAYATDQDAMTDVLRLSRAMTLKTAVAGLPR